MQPHHYMIQAACMSVGAGAGECHPDIKISRVLCRLVGSLQRVSCRGCIGWWDPLLERVRTLIPRFPHIPSLQVFHFKVTVMPGLSRAYIVPQKCARTHARTHTHTTDQTPHPHPTYPSPPHARLFAWTCQPPPQHTHIHTAVYSTSTGAKTQQLLA